MKVDFKAMEVLLLLIFSVLGKRVAGNFCIDLDDHWNNFKKAYGKMYKEEEECFRRQNWENLILNTLHHNLRADLGLEKFSRGLNAYADLTKEEFQKYKTGFKMDDRPRSFGSSRKKALSSGKAPNEIDWRQKGYVTSVMDQGECGCCWATTAVGSLEAQHKNKTGELVELSVQNLIDCAPSDGGGCQGGWMTAAFQYVQENGGIDTEESYPYTGQEEDCKYDENSVGATCSGYEEIPEGDEEALKIAVGTVGPVAAAIDATLESFQTYKSGIYEDENCNSQSMNHAVLVVGYGTEDGTDYWLVKNSWGESWGMKGYMKIIRNYGNQCGLATRASYPIA